MFNDIVRIENYKSLFDRNIMVVIPKTRKTHCKKCVKHTNHKVG